MRIDEFDDMMPSGLYNAGADKVSVAHVNDSRKSTLSLRDLNRLKKLRAFKKLQSLKREDSLAMIYGQGEEDPSL